LSGKKYTRCRRLVPDIMAQVSHQYGGQLATISL